jgi:hypothetical protein
VRGIPSCLPLLVAIPVNRVWYLRRGFLGIEAWQINLEKKPGSEEGEESGDDCSLLRICWASGEEGLSVQPLAAKHGTYWLFCLCCRCNVTTSAALSSGAGPPYNPGQEAVSEDARAW